jgi:hypothetical protein
MPEHDIAGSVRPGAVRLVVPVVVGTAVAVALGAYGGLHDPSPYARDIPGFSNHFTAKSWLTTVALGLGLVQVVTAAGMWGRLGLRDHGWTAPVHRWSGRLAVVTLLPVVAMCLYELGFRAETPRILAHSLLGCFFFGAFAAKMLALRARDLPAWAIPVAGGLVFAALVGLWLTSSLWFFTEFGMAP